MTLIFIDFSDVGSIEKIAHEFENIFKHCVSTDYEVCKK